MIASASLTAQFLDYPLRKVAVITSDFGDRPSPLKNGSNFHTGTDFGVKIGSAVISVSEILGIMDFTRLNICRYILCIFLLYVMIKKYLLLTNIYSFLLDK